MTIKKIWKDFGKSVKESASSAWKQIRNVAKATFGLFKTTIIDSIVGILTWAWKLNKGIFTWLWSLVSGVVVIAWDLIKFVFSTLIVSIKLTVGVFLSALINFIRKW